MFKVICINHDMFDLDATPFGPTDPQIGDECEVTAICSGWTFDNIEVPCFRLKGYKGFVYDQRNFAPLSDIDETELVNTELATA